MEQGANKKTKQLANADVAQSVERRLGKAEVTGSIPVISLLKKDPGKPGFFHYIKTTGDRSEKTR